MSRITITVEDGKQGRMDVFLSTRLEITRSAVKSLLERGNIILNGEAVKAGRILKQGDIIEVEQAAAQADIEPENIPLNITYEDECLAIINKARGMVVHPSSNCFSGTLVNALLYHFKNLSSGGRREDIDDEEGAQNHYRAGIVHRLDKDTTGLLVIAKTDEAHNILSKQIAQKEAKRIYHAIVEGVVKDDGGTITTYIDRDRNDRKKMAVSQSGKLAITHYEVLERFSNNSYLRFELGTGRTHQIRVHARQMGHPIVGDKAYGYKKQVFFLEGQLLHSKVLVIMHPKTKEIMTFDSELPNDFLKVLEVLRKTNR